MRSYVFTANELKLKVTSSLFCCWKRNGHEIYHSAIQLFSALDYRNHLN